MAGSKQAGPTCQSLRYAQVQDGTMCRSQSPLPGLIGQSVAMQVELTVPDGQRVFHISNAPEMPLLIVEASICPSPPPGSLVDYSWNVQVHFAGSETPHGVAGSDLILVRFTNDGMLVISPTEWGRICGGNLSVSVTVMVNGSVSRADLLGLTIVGTNPSQATVQDALGTDVLRRIAHQESNFRQFGDDSWPRFSEDNLGGAGIMQITPANEAQRWNWRSNVQAGIDKYDHSYGLTNTFVQSVRSSNQFANLVVSLNQFRATQQLPPLTVTVPNWTDDQRMRDAIRGYNGWAGSDPVVPNLHLHEYRLARDTNGRLRVTQTPNSNEAQAIWEQVPAEDRPQTVGDPDYVAHVLAQSP